jgi:hypothetical protein
MWRAEAGGARQGGSSPGDIEDLRLLQEWIMKKLLALACVALMAGTAVAQIPGMGLFFSDTEFTDENTNSTAIGSPTNAYIVLLNSPYQTILAYEVGITISNEAAVFVTAVSGPNGWTNFGSNTNHLCGYQTPLIVDGAEQDNAVVLATMALLNTTVDQVDISFGPASPSSFDGLYPGIANGADPTQLAWAFSAGGESPGLVATFNGPGVTATESRSLSSIKALF